ncbi:hypothetical protein G6F31_015263 [Rhizopus arrhizus]|nr:hypothetical protein G6F31_015263 [Rhizopus arrhizus]
MPGAQGGRTALVLEHLAEHARVGEGRGLHAVVRRDHAAARRDVGHVAVKREQHRQTRAQRRQQHHGFGIDHRGARGADGAPCGHAVVQRVHAFGIEREARIRVFRGRAGQARHFGAVAADDDLAVGFANAHPGQRHGFVVHRRTGRQPA